MIAIKEIIHQLHPIAIHAIRLNLITPQILITRHWVFQLFAPNAIQLIQAGRLLLIQLMIPSSFQSIPDVIRGNGLYAQIVIQMRRIMRYLIAFVAILTHTEEVTIQILSVILVIQEELQINVN
jgi:hypothetical protein